MNMYFVKDDRKLILIHENIHIFNIFFLSWNLGGHYSLPPMPGGGALVFQAGYHPPKRIFKTHPKHIFFRYENRPLNMFLHAFFLNCASRPFQNLSMWPKTYPFSNFARFCTPKRCTHVHWLVLKNNPNYVNFLRGWYPTSNTSEK